MKPEIIESKEQAAGKYVADYLQRVEPELSAKGVVITFIEGTAAEPLPLIAPNKVHRSGTIKAPAEFWAKRKGEHNPQKCHVLYDMLKGTIKLVVDENFESENYEITGKMEPNPDLVKFGINSNNTLDPKEMLQLLKFNRFYFEDKTVNAAICAELQGFKAKVTQEFEKSDNLVGQAKQLLESKIETELQKSFKLEMPLFKGGAKQKFKVDVCLQVRNGEVKVYLESVELKDMQMKLTEETVAKELENLSELVCIEQ